MRMTSDEAPLHGGGGMKYAPLALPRLPALNLFQGRLLLPGRGAFQRKGLLHSRGRGRLTHARYES